MKKCHFCLLVIFVLVASLLCGCAEDKVKNEIDEMFLCPWTYDVSASAKEDGMIHYYFMSSEGYIRKESGEPAKWGDCCLVVFPNGETMLIDGGPRVYGNMLVSNLKRMGVQKIDHLVISHPHLDHQAGIFHADNLTGDGLLDQFEVSKVYHRGGSDNKREDSLWVENVCTERNLPLRTLEKGDTFSIGEVQIEILWPMPGTSETVITGGVAVNDSSIVMRLNYKNHSSMFVGDLYKAGELIVYSANPTRMNVDLLKVPHHGSDTSSSEILLKGTSPEIAVATGFIEIPEDVRAAYDAHGVTLLNDRTYGYVHVSSDGINMGCSVSREAEIPADASASGEKVSNTEVE
ncbi:MAG: MBL fold metallo-hydrolase [Oscillospiraceae bacterium]|nr:MBL fold metallo-hydrolase [Oscillospiraceae bacterium]